MDSDSARQNSPDNKNMVELSPQQVAMSEKTWSEYAKEQPESKALLGYSGIIQNQVIKNINNLSPTDLKCKLTMVFDLSPFINLSHLWLNRNQILSVENLLQMQIPNIRKLSFSYNKLISVRSLRRLNLPKLDQIQLDHNHITDALSLTQLKLYLKHSEVSLWLFFSEKSIENDMLSKCINAKIYPYIYKV